MASPGCSAWRSSTCSAFADRPRLISPLVHDRW
jgi:hypothetical protein